MRATSRSLFGSTEILLVDGVGALLTALSVGLVLPAFAPFIGLPVASLRLLGVVALGFAAFSLGRHFTRTATAGSLRLIAVANLSYCAVTSALLIVYAHTVTPLGAAYFVGEIVIVVALSARELGVARRVDATRSR
ncbi:MAG: hypothetical protein AB7S26_10510 [Sandaracinaceae bacterium]